MDVEVVLPPPAAVQRMPAAEDMGAPALFAMYADRAGLPPEAATLGAQVCFLGLLERAGVLSRVARARTREMRAMKLGPRAPVSGLLCSYPCLCQRWLLGQARHTPQRKLSPPDLVSDRRQPYHPTCGGSMAGHHRHGTQQLTTGAV